MKMSLTAAQAKKFNELVDDTSSRDQLERIKARLRLNRFVIRHGKEACDEAFKKENARRKRKGE